MKKDYFGPHKTGGSILSKGIVYQDLVSLLYLFRYIHDGGFKEITFETHDDFTIITDSCEVYVQVKNTHLTLSQVRKILKLKSRDQENDSVKHVVVASGYNNKCKSLIVNLKYLKNTYNSFRSEQEKNKIENEFNQLLDDIDPQILHEIEFDEVPSTQLTEAIKFYMYQWASSNKFTIDIDDWFDKIMANISLRLRPDRGSLKRKDIEALAINSPRNKQLIHGTSQSEVQHFGHSKEKILVALNKDIADKKHFSEKLTLIKMFIETGRLEDAIQHSFELIEYKDTFSYYYLWLQFEANNYEALIQICNQMIDQNKCTYHSYYYLGLVTLSRKEYSKAISYFKNASLIDSTFDINLRLAQTYSCLGSRETSLKYYRYCLSKEPLNPNLLLEISKLLPSHEAITSLDQVIKINPSLHRAYFEKGKILRYYGFNEDAYAYFRKYLEFQVDIGDLPNEVSKEISLCLLSLEDEAAFNYMNNWLPDFLYHKNNDKVKDGGTIEIIESYWNHIQLILCTKYGEDYIVRTSIREYVLFKPQKSFIAIGCVEDFFLKMSAEAFQKYDKKIVKNGYEYLPAIMKFYSSKDEFDKIIKSMRLQESARLNKDYHFDNEADQSRWHFKEYISKSETTFVIIEELQNAFHIQVKVGISSITGWFNKGGDGYFRFCSKVEEPPPFNETVLVLECLQSKEKLHIKFHVKNIKILKKATFPQGTFIKDIELPID
ncbi:dsDNA nuclease domain-containing protein [Paenibacillus polymyxa]|uniref:dsDNA nuclease domain-containing protein n=1 Tax=Paenibacillus polymyxa TaxID=1406 RepID=UPI0018666E97|nr:hypothetical protein [Paenibacillus polymyxa]MBE3650749.1 hypothetical protein [Paenibacillus polymyxa]